MPKVPESAARTRSVSPSRRPAEVPVPTMIEKKNMKAPVQISVKTGNFPNAETLADISIVLIGTDGTTGELGLKSKRTNFIPGKVRAVQQSTTVVPTILKPRALLVYELSYRCQKLLFNICI